MDAEDLDLRLGEFRGDLDLLLAALDSAGLCGAILELDGDADELHTFAEQKTRDDPQLLSENVSARPRPWRGIWPFFRWRSGGGAVKVPIEGENLHDLRTLALDFAEPEIAICLDVRQRDGTLLISAPDLGDDEIWVNSRRLTPASVEALRTALGPALR